MVYYLTLSHHTHIHTNTHAGSLLVTQFNQVNIVIHAQAKLNWEHVCKCTHWFILIVYTCTCTLTLKLRTHTKTPPLVTLWLKHNTHAYTCSDLGPPKKESLSQLMVFDLHTFLVIKAILAITLPKLMLLSMILTYTVHNIHMYCYSTHGI